MTWTWWFSRIRIVDIYRAQIFGRSARDMKLSSVAVGLVATLALLVTAHAEVFFEENFEGMNFFILNISVVSHLCTREFFHRTRN